MKTELFYLLLTAILTGLLWIPVVIGYVNCRRCCPTKVHLVDEIWPALVGLEDDLCWSSLRLRDGSRLEHWRGG